MTRWLKSRPAPEWQGNWSGHHIATRAEADLRPLFSAFGFPSHEAPRTTLDLRFWHAGATPLDMAPGAWRAKEHWLAGEQLRIFGANGSRRLFDPFSRTVTTFQPAEGLADVWFQSPGHAPAWVRAAPALQLIDWWALEHGMLATHAAAVAFDGRAVLLLGPGGSGKSTFAVEAASRGHAFLGDDYVLLEPEVPRVHSLYRSVKLRIEDGKIPRHPRFGSPLPGIAEDEKAVLFAEEAALVGSAPLAAVIVLRVGGSDRPVITMISPAEAVRRAAPSILRQMPGSEPAKLALLARGVRARPCFALDLAQDHAANVAAVEDLLMRLPEEAVLG